MYRQLSIVVLLTIMLFSACNQNAVDLYDEQLDLNRAKNLFNDSLWIGFPDKVSNDVRVLVGYNPPVLKGNLNYYGIFILEKIEEAKINTLSAFISKYAKAFFSLKTYEDICEENSILIFSLKGSNNEFSDSMDYIFPNYYEKYSPVKDYVDESGWIAAILDTRYGEFNGIDFTESTTSFYDHGLSRGFFINKKADSMIYWLISW